MVLKYLYEVFIKDSSDVKGFVVDKIIADSYSQVISFYRDVDIVLVKFIDSIKVL